MRRSTATHVVHARVNHARGDAAPDAVGDPKLAFHHKVPQVVRQLGPCPGELLHPVDDTVVAFDKRVGVRMVGEPTEGDSHISNMRASSSSNLTIFRGDIPCGQAGAHFPGAEASASPVTDNANPEEN